MQHFSDELPLVLVGATDILASAFKSIYEDLVKAWLLKKLTEWGVTPMGSTFIDGLINISSAVILAVAVVCLTYRYAKRGSEYKSAEFVRKLALPSGDEGYYAAYVSVMNTSSTKKLKDCRCEMHKLMASNSRVIYRSIVLCTKNREDMDVNGRFKIDQKSLKEIPVFYIDQSRDDDNGVRIVSIGKNDIHLPHGTYLATLRCFGDEGPPDEITVRINTNSCEYDLLEKSVGAQTTYKLRSTRTQNETATRTTALRPSPTCDGYSTRTFGKA